MASFGIDPSAIRNILTSRSGPVAVELLKRGRAVRNCARASAPVDTGALRSSIFVELTTRGNNTLVVKVGSRVKYARFVEEGTRFMAAQPYLIPCLERFGRG